MAIDENKKHWVPHLPGILTGTAALLAAMTTVYMNVRNDKPVVASSVDVTTTATPVTVKPLPKPVTLAPAVPSNETIEIKLDRIRVDNDGSMGTTDWTFDILSGERSLFSIPFKSLSDKAGENLVSPADTEIARAKLSRLVGSPSEITVHGWKQAFSGKAQEPDVVGKAVLNSDGTGLSIEAKSGQETGPAFVLYFDANTLSK
jgi:hypothetical protein